MKLRYGPRRGAINSIIQKALGRESGPRTPRRRAALLQSGASLSYRQQGRLEAKGIRNVTKRLIVGPDEVNLVDLRP